MPLPLPDLDDRRWEDLVEEARALIPQLAPAWTDVNLSDPGVTLIDLLAYLTEAGVFAVDRIPRSHRERFLELAGIRQRPFRPAVTAVGFASRSGQPTVLPVGAVLATSSGGQSWLHRLPTPDGGPDPAVALTIWGCGLGAVQTWTGSDYLDRTADVAHATAFAALGDDPGSAAGAGAALLLGLGTGPALPADARLSLWLSLDDGATAGLAGAEPEVPAGTPHPGFTTTWESFDGTAWQPFDGVLDETRSLTRSGRLVLPLGAADPPAAVVGAVTDPHRWVRVRAAAGRPDVAPRMLGVLTDAAPVAQSVPAAADWPLADGHTPLPAWARPGAQAHVRLRTDESGNLLEVAEGAQADPMVAVLPSAPGSLGLTLVPAGVADGGPAFPAVVPGAPLAVDGLGVWTADTTGLQRWEVRDTLLRSTPDDRHVVVDQTSGELCFGDGEHGRCPAAGSTVVVAAGLTLGAAGTPTALSTWSLAGADPRTRAVFAPGAPDSADLLVTAARPVLPGSSLEELAAAEGRAAERVWAHERLLELADGASTLDQADPAVVRSRARPERAATLFDYERIALEVPGTAVLRARAWAEVDPAQPGLVAEGTVTVVVVPGLPAGRPQPTAATLAAVRAWLCERRTLGTRLVVTGPDYVEVQVRAVLQSLTGSDPERVRGDALATLRRYLDPLAGGPAGRGWPFGRDVHRADVLARLDGVAGVDHVLELELLVAGHAAGCGSVCLTPLQLVVSGAHQVEVR